MVAGNLSCCRHAHLRESEPSSWTPHYVIVPTNSSFNSPKSLSKWSELYWLFHGEMEEKIPSHTPQQNPTIFSVRNICSSLKAHLWPPGTCGLSLPCPTETAQPRWPQLSFTPSSSPWVFPCLPVPPPHLAPRSFDRAITPSILDSHTVFLLPGQKILARFSYSPNKAVGAF